MIRAYSFYIETVGGICCARCLIACRNLLSFAPIAGCFFLLSRYQFLLLLHNRLHVAHAVVNYYFLQLRRKAAVRSFDTELDIGPVRKGRCLFF